MGKEYRKSKYSRCPVCKELVSDVANCGNCAAHADDPQGLRKPRGNNTIRQGRKGASQLDMIEGNKDWWGQ